jgi:hypothetical protein
VTVSPVDRVRVEAMGVPGSAAAAFNFEDFTSFSLHNSMLGPSECAFELGDETGYDRLSEFLKLGARFRVFVNDRLRLTSRVEQHDASLAAERSMTESFTVRTKLTDAIFSSAPLGVRVHGVSIKQFLLAIYKSIGVLEADFDFRGDVSRDLLTGKNSSGKRPPIPLAPLTEEELKVQPPESIFQACDRFLRRHGLLHWDGPDGKIIVAAPDDEQVPSYVARCLRGAEAQFNNIMEVTRSQDVSEAPTELGVFGTGKGKAGFASLKGSAVVSNPDLIAAGFVRRVAILDEAMSTRALALRRAARELSLKNRGLEKLVITFDGLAFRDGLDPVPWSPDTTLDVILESLGGALGVYYVEDVQMSRNASDGDRTRITAVPKGVWVL